MYRLKEVEEIMQEIKFMMTTRLQDRRSNGTSTSFGHEIKWRSRKSRKDSGVILNQEMVLSSLTVKSPA